MKKESESRDVGGKMSLNVALEYPAITRPRAKKGKNRNTGICIAKEPTKQVAKISRVHVHGERGLRRDATLGLGLLHLFKHLKRKRASAGPITDQIHSPLETG